MTWLTVTEYMCLKWPRICSVCRNNNPVLDSFITYYRVCNKSNTMSATCGAGTANPYLAHEFTPVFNEVRIARCAFSVSLFVLLSLYFVHCVVCPSSIYGFWLPLWYLQTIFDCIQVRCAIICHITLRYVSMQYIK